MKSSLNLIYRVIWSDKNNAWVVTSELTKSKSKKSQKSVCFDSAGKPSALESFTGKLRSIRFLSGLVAVAGLTFSSLSTALPFGYEVIFGKMTTDTQGANMSIHQGSQKLIANWQSFDIAQGEKVSLFQPNGGAALFRILGNNATQIFGQLDATANLFLFNPNGIYFGKTANVNVGSIVASTLDIKNQDFLNGHYAFAGQGHYGNVTNDGVIHAGKEGYIVLLGESVTNNGTLVANNGSVVLGSANKAVLDFYGNGMLHVKLSGDALNAYVTNTGNIDADGGIVQMATSARSAAINTSGIVQAHNLVERDGVIRLEAGATGTVTVAGALDVSGADSHGGTVALLGDQVALMDGAYVNATGATGGGKVLVGGNYQGKGPEQNASATYVAQGAVINASATKNGNGGKVIVWGNDYMQSHGNIIARGGEYSGNGGFVETSSHGEFAVTSAPNVGASHGLAGTWLIDPIDLTINNAATTAVTGATPFSPTGAGASISWATIDAGLATGNVVVTTVGTGTAGAGDITVSAAGVLNNTHNLTIDAAGKIDFNQGLTRNAAGDLTLNANNNVTVNGSISLATSSNLNIKSSTGSVNVNVDIVTKGGDVDIQAANAIDFDNILTTFSPAAGPGATSVSGSVNMIASNGSITGGNITTSGSANGAGGAVNIDAGTSVSVGNINTSAGGLTAGNDGRSAGNVFVSGLGAVTLGAVTANGSDAQGVNKAGGNSGEVVVVASSNITTGSISSVSGKGTGTQASGTNRKVDLSTDTNVGNITVNGDITTSGGNILLNTLVGGDIRAQNIQTTTHTPTNPAATTASGQLIVSTASGAVSLGAINTSGSANGGGGAVSIDTVNGGITTGAINTSAGNVLSGMDGRGAGNVSLSTTGTGAINIGNVAANGSDAQGVNKTGGNSGEVSVIASSSISSGSISSVSGKGTGTHSSGSNRKVALTTDTNVGNIIVNGDITTSGGDVALNTLVGGDIRGQNIQTTTHAPTNNLATLGSGQVVVATAAGLVNLGNINTAGSANGSGGAVSIDAVGGGVTTLAITTSGGSVLSSMDGRSAGNVAVTGDGTVRVGPIIANGSDGSGVNSQGGNSGEVIVASTSGSVYLGAISAINGLGALANGQGRNIFVRAGLDVITGGNITSTSNSQPTAVSNAAVLIVAGRDFDNSSNSNISFAHGATGSWLIYSTNPNNPNDVRGAQLDASYGFKEYNRAYSPFDVPLGTAAGYKNGFIYSEPQYINVVLSGTTSKPFDGTPVVTNTAGLVLTASLTDGDQLVTGPSVTNLNYDNSLVGVGKPVNGNFTVSTAAVDSMGRPVFGYQSTTQSVATGTIFIGVAPRDSAGLGTLLSNLNLFNGLTVQALNPAAGDDDPDYIPCPENSDRIGRNSVLNSGVKMPAEVIATCI